MQRKRVTVLCQGIAACAVWVFGLAMLQSAAPAQTTETQTEKTAKPKKAKKAATEATPAPAAAEEKTSKTKKSKAAAESTSSTATPAAAEEKAAKPRKSKKAGADVTAPTPAVPAAGESVPMPKKANRSVPEVIPSGSANRANRSTEPPAASVSGAEIQAAKASGMVWVNTESGVYHKGGQWYGATKQGKFMTERDAIRSGYRAAKNE